MLDETKKKDICDGCPAAYHKSCLDGEKNKIDILAEDDLDSDIEDNRWFCPHCTTVKFLPYGSLVWGKVSHTGENVEEIISPQKNILDWELSMVACRGCPA